MVQPERESLTGISRSHDMFVSHTYVMAYFIMAFMMLLVS